MEHVKKASKRVLTFDLMRGWFLLAIIIDHIAFFPNGLEWMSARGGLFVTTAEGFFFISGLVLGIVRGAKLIEKPFKVVANLLLKRGVQLYLWSVLLTVLFTLITWVFFEHNPNVKQAFLPSSTPLWEVLYRALTFDYVYGWADYLRLYAIFLFASPIVFWLLRRGLWYVALLLSLGVWALFPNDFNFDYQMQEKLQFLSWQLIFFSGAIIGFHWEKIRSWWDHISLAWRRTAIAALLVVGSATLFYNVMIMFATMGFDLSWLGVKAQMQHDFYVAFFDKERMPLYRFGLFLLWFWMFFYLFQRFERQIVRFVGWLLLPFGQNSLYVYTIHAFLMYAIHLIWQQGPMWHNFLITAGAIAIIRVMIHYRILMKIIPR